MLSRRRRAILLLLATLLAVLIGGRLAAELLVEYWWYESLGQERVFWVLHAAGVAVRSLVALLVGGFVFANLWVVSRSLGTIRVRRRYANIEIAEQLPQGYVLGALALISLFSAWWLSAGLANPLPMLAAFRHAAWGAAEPVFGRGLSFYVFVYPVLEGAQTLAGLLFFWTALLAAAAYVATGALRVVEGRPQLAVGARRHLGLLAAGFLLVIALDAWLDRYGLVVQGTGVGDAIGYADLHARLPGRAIIALLAVVAAGAVAWGVWHASRRAPLAALALLALAVVGTQLVYPQLLQKLVVDPNEFPREREAIERHLAFTRLAYGLRELRSEPLPYRFDVEADPERVLDILEGVPLWDERPLLTAFAQRQSLFPYYDFLSVHVDRYGEGERAEPVAISVRELIPGRLPQSAQTWQNLHLNYVSAQGAVVSPTTGIAADGAPVYYLSDLNPPRTSPGAPESVRLDEPDVFFGERADGYVILREGSGPRGVPLDAGWKRLAFAWAFQSKNLVLSSEVTPDSRIVYRRQILERARAVAPFLRFLEQDGAYPVLLDGRVVWVLDGYTASATFPLSRLVNFQGARVRYIRNSAKVTVDGVSGEVRVYGVDEDPVLRTYGAFFPGLVRPAAEMPPALRRHLRYPAALQALQADVLGEYHLTDTRAFYEKDDVWAVATENYRSESVPTVPAYAMLPLAGEEQPEFQLISLFVARGRQNMTALLATRNDPPHYGEQILYLLPRDEQVPGPQQVESMIDQDPEISQQLSLWRQGGSDVIRGHLLPVPIDSTLFFVEPLFLESESAAIPQLERVIVAQGNRVVMRPTLEAAVEVLTGASPDTAGGEQRPAPAAGAAPGSQLLQRARQLMERAEAQLRAGDWAEFGRTWEALRDALRSAPPATGTFR